MKPIALTCLVAAALVSFWSGGAVAQSADTASQSSRAVTPDNTKSNAQDRSNRSRTADEQKNNSSDVEITQKIRRSVMDDKSLSTYAHNAKIVAENGTVTLNGVVKTSGEKSTLEQLAARVVGADRVVNNLKVDTAQ
jgi:hyperosmotically inducible periplasmic protein